MILLPSHRNVVKPERSVGVWDGRPLQRDLLMAHTFPSGLDDLKDGTPWGNDGVASGGPTERLSRFGKSLHFVFPFADPRIEILNPTPRLLNAPFSAFTLVFWFNADNAVTNTPAISWRHGTDAVSGEHNFYPNDSKVGSGGTRVFIRGPGDVISENGPNLSGAWHQFVYTSRNGNEHTAYRDGKVVATSSAAITNGGLQQVTIAAFRGIEQGFNGILDAFFAYGRVLTIAEIEELYHDPFAPVRPRPILFAPSSAVVADPITQARHRWRNDDGTEATATWAAPEDVGITLAAGERRRLRVQLQTEGDQGAVEAELRFRRQGTADPWEPVP